VSPARSSASASSTARRTTSCPRASTSWSGLRRPEAQDLRRRQARRPARQQGRHLQDPADRGHAVPRGRHPGRHRAQPARACRAG
jgi:hypothetical protein